MAKEYFPFTGKIPFEGKDSKNVMAFHYYDPEKVVMGKKMKDWLKFAMAWWHTLGGASADQFGGETRSYEWSKAADPVQRAKDKMDAGFEIMDKLGIEYFCFHDIDLVQEADTIAEYEERMKAITDYALEKMKQFPNIKLLWGTANVFSNGISLFNEVNVVEAEIPNTEFIHYFKTGIHFILCTLNGISSFVPLVATSLTTELVSTCTAERVPPSHSELQPILHFLSHHDLFRLVVVESHYILTVLSFERNLTGKREILFSHNCLVIKCLQTIIQRLFPSLVCILVCLTIIGIRLNHL